MPPTVEIIYVGNHVITDYKGMELKFIKDPAPRIGA
jgi:hypothetical protein